MLLMAIGIIVAVGIVVILYFAYETYSLGKNGTMLVNDQPQTPTEQQRVIKSLTAPAQAPSSSAATPAATPSGSSGAQAPRDAAAGAPKPPSSLTAPSPSSGAAAQAQEDQATVDSLTAPH